MDRRLPRAPRRNDPDAPDGDVPLGMFLSGGVDSSSIAAIMQRMVTGKVKTFSVGYKETAYSELEYARATATALDTDHHEVQIGMEDFFNALPRLVWHEDEPITWPSSVSLYFVSKLARKNVKVVLTGEGGDELFAGYSRYRFYAKNDELLKYYQLVPGPLRRMIRAQIGVLATCLGATARRKLQHTFVGRGEDLESLYLDNFYSAFSAAEQKALHSMTESPYASYRRLLGCGLRSIAVAANVVRRSEDISGRVVDEAGSDEHGVLHRKPCAAA